MYLCTYNIFGPELVLPIGEGHGDILPELNKDRFERPLRKDFSLVNLGDILMAFDNTGDTLSSDKSFCPRTFLFSRLVVVSSAKIYQQN